MIGQVARRLSAIAACLCAMACADPDPVVVGVALSSEGITAARFAAAEINATHGIRGRPLVVRAYVDNGTHARNAIDIAERLAGDPLVVAVVGHSNSSTTLAGAHIYNREHLVQIAPTSSAPLLSGIGPYTVRLVASDVHQARFLAAQLIDRPRTAVFYVNDDYGRALHRALRDQLLEQHVPILLEVPYEEELRLPDVDAVARRIVEDNVRQIVWLGRAAQLHQLLTQLKRGGHDVGVLASDGVDSRETSLNADGVMTGVRFTRFVDLEKPRTSVQALIAKYQAKTGDTLTVEMMLTYDAVMLVAEAARERGVHRADIAGYVQSLGNGHPPFEGATRTFTFDKDGNPLPRYCLVEVGLHGVQSVPARELP